MTIFATIVYPDNEKRAKRAYELSNDCVLYYQRLSRQKEEIDAALAALTTAFGALPEGIREKRGATERLNLDKDWVVVAPYFAGQFLLKKTFGFALDVVAKAWAVQQGRAATTVLSTLVRLPRWLVMGCE